MGLHANISLPPPPLSELNCHRVTDLIAVGLVVDPAELLLLVVVLVVVLVVPEGPEADLEVEGDLWDEGRALKQFN